MASASKSRTNLVRLPLHRGPFYFAPRFLSSRAAWFENFAALVTKAVEHAGYKAEISSPGDGWQVQAKLNALVFTIDAEGGMFGLAEPDEDEDWRPDRFWVAEIPALFVQGIEAEPIPEHLAHDARSARHIADWLHRVMKSRFERALENNDAHLEARFSSELSDFAKLDRDQSVLFDVDERVREKFFEKDDELDSATARASGAKLFSFCVVPAKDMTIRALEEAPEKEGTAGKRGRPRSVDYNALDEVMLGLIRKRGIPKRTNAAWNNQRLQEMVVKQMAERGLKVSRPTVLNKIPLVIEMFKKELSHKHFQQSNNSKIYQN
jgi:hypothetical protein